MNQGGAVPLSQPKLLIATRNPGKLREYRQLLHGVPFTLVSLKDVGITDEVEETGQTFQENAWLKARAAAALLEGRFETCPYVLGDDSGLEVDALGGEPGIHSARYGEESPLTALYERGVRGDLDRVKLLLRKLEGVPWERRTARFRCVIAIAIPPSPLSVKSPHTPLYERGARGDFPKGSTGSVSATVGARGALISVVGAVAGMIQYEPQGDEGFGYDPVFYLPSYNLTMAQLPLEEKNRISHRADAARKAVAELKSLAV